MSKNRVLTVNLLTGVSIILGTLIFFTSQFVNAESPPPGSPPAVVYGQQPRVRITSGEKCKELGFNASTTTDNFKTFGKDYLEVTKDGKTETIPYDGASTDQQKTGKTKKNQMAMNFDDGIRILPMPTFESCLEDFESNGQCAKDFKEIAEAKKKFRNHCEKSVGKIKDPEETKKNKCVVAIEFCNEMEDGEGSEWDSDKPFSDSANGAFQAILQSKGIAMPKISGEEFYQSNCSRYTEKDFNELSETLKSESDRKSRRLEDLRKKIAELPGQTEEKVQSEVEKQEKIQANIEQMKRGQDKADGALSSEMMKHTIDTQQGIRKAERARGSSIAKIAQIRSQRAAFLASISSSVTDTQCLAQLKDAMKGFDETIGGKMASSGDAAAALARMGTQARTDIFAFCIENMKIARQATVEEYNTKIHDAEEDMKEATEYIRTAEYTVAKNKQDMMAATIKNQQNMSTDVARLNQQFFKSMDAVDKVHKNEEQKSNNLFMEVQRSSSELNGVENQLSSLQKQKPRAGATENPGELADLRESIMEKIDNAKKVCHKDGKYIKGVKFNKDDPGSHEGVE